MEDVVLPLSAVLGVLALLLLGIGSILLRRLLLGRGGGVFDCGFRTGDHRPGAGWVAGIARYERDRVDWFRALGWNLRPAASLQRGQVEVVERRAVAGPESLALMPGALVVVCRHGADVVELAMSEGAYAGFASWLESAPPGQNVDVA